MPIVYDKNFLIALCTAYQIGEYLLPPIRMHGGLLHEVYQLKTSQGAFILKLLNPTIINREGRAERFRVTEKIARQLSPNVPAVCALTHHDADVLYFFDNQVIMLYPFIQGKIMPTQKITQKHAQIIGKILAQIHECNMQIDNAPKVELLDITKLNKNIKECLQIKNLPDAVKNKLMNCLPAIETIAMNCQRYSSVVKQNLIVSHRDLDPKNVLWDKNEHEYLIDWESAGFINKTKDTLATGLYFSFDEHFQVNQNRLIAFTTAYQKNGMDILINEAEAGLYGFLADWLTWLDFNLTRLLTHPNESAAFILGEKETCNTCDALTIVLKQFPAIIDLLCTK